MIYYRENRSIRPASLGATGFVPNFKLILLAALITAEAGNAADQSDRSAASRRHDSQSRRKTQLLKFPASSRLSSLARISRIHVRTLCSPDTLAHLCHLCRCSYPTMRHASFVSKFSVRQLHFLKQLIHTEVVLKFTDNSFLLPH